MGPLAKQSVSTIWSVFRHIFRWGWIPFIVSLGLRHGGDPGMPEPSMTALFWG